ncbi:histidine phosphatase family protein [Latilactobacillus fragifolii]|uniref:histidine phosphatase family protein n=1 Tax=Latilactobacillus fragifolii TaxID=2814244 RepID=UPI001ABBA2DE|nr:histidine phosphatase family protein [Latilactobacillus fragifolii]
MTTLYLIRHGKTEWNLEGRYQGAHGDSPLLASSYVEIEELAHFLKPIHFDHLYTSPLKRTRETSITLKRDLGQDFPITVVEALHEFNLGLMEGMRFTEVEKQYPAIVKAFREAPADYDPTEIKGETFEQVIARTTQAIDTIVKAAQPDDHILIVSHGAAMVAMIQSLLKTPLAQVRKDGGVTNSSVTTLTTDNQGASFNLVKWNDTHFLSKQLSTTDTI